MNILSQISRPFAVFVTIIALSWLIAFVLTSFIPAELLTFLGVFAFFALWPMCMAFALATDTHRWTQITLIANERAGGKKGSYGSATDEHRWARGGMVFDRSMNCGGLSKTD